jgi:hypothetical protein
MVAQGPAGADNMPIRLLAIADRVLNGRDRPLSGPEADLVNSHPRLVGLPAPLDPP